MKLVLLRHATRSSHSMGDAALNNSGLTQAIDFVSKIAPHGSLPQPTRLISSPKRRARETLQPTSDSFHIDLEIDPRLDERKQSESMQEFEKRVSNFLDEITATAGHGSVFQNPDREPCIYVVSHLDWLETAMSLLPTDLPELERSMSWATLEYRAFRFHDDLWANKESGYVPVR